MLIGVLQKKTLRELAEAVQRLDASLYDLLELRLDVCEDLSLQGLDSISLPRPAIFSLPGQAEGGAYPGDEASRLRLLADLARLKPAYLDIEASTPPGHVRRLRVLSPETGLILSRYDFNATPADPGVWLQAMRENLGWNDAGVLYKLAAYARSTEDALRMLVFCRKAGQGRKVIGVCMGEYGESANILAPVTHGGFCYCPVEERPAPGQLTASVLRDVYNFKYLNKDTAIYGLIGDPVDQNRDHVYHNERNAWHGCNAVYVKWRLSSGQLSRTLPLLEQVGVRGLSVTMPLKRAALSHLSDIPPQLRAIGAVNTLKAVEGGWLGLNTDGAGALACLPPRLRNLTGKKVVVLGAGNAGRAVIQALDMAGASVMVYNRTINKSLPWNDSSPPIRPLDKRTELRDLDYDLVINALPFGLDISFDQTRLRAEALAMDLSYGAPSAFLRAARASGCETLDGSGMFAAQAALQRRFWGLP